MSLGLPSFGLALLPAVVAVQSPAHASQASAYAETPFQSTTVRTQKVVHVVVASLETRTTFALVRSFTTAILDRVFRNPFSLDSRNFKICTLFLREWWDLVSDNERSTQARKGEEAEPIGVVVGQGREK